MLQSVNLCTLMSQLQCQICELEIVRIKLCALFHKGLDAYGVYMFSYVSAC